MRPRCATSVGTPVSTFFPSCYCAPASSISRSSAASSRPGCTTDRRPPNWRRSAANRVWPPLLDGAVRDLESEHDPVERQRHALTFWDHVVDGADSIVFRLMYNTLRATYEPALPALAALMAAEVGRPDAYREVAGAIAAGDADAAKKAAIDLLEPATTAMLAAIKSLEEQP